MVLVANDNGMVVNIPNASLLAYYWHVRSCLDEILQYTFFVERNRVLYDAVFDFVDDIEDIIKEIGTEEDFINSINLLRLDPLEEQCVEETDIVGALDVKRRIYPIRKIFKLRQV